jgi:hypothetical protein
VFAADDENGKLLRKAHMLTKAWPPMTSLEPMVSTGADAFPTVTRRPGSSPARQSGTDDGLGGTAYDKLMQMVERQRRDGETQAAAFVRIYSDPANRHLAEAERAENRPGGMVRMVG